MPLDHPDRDSRPWVDVAVLAEDPATQGVIVGKHKGELSLPGGRVDVYETLEAAAHREFREETGLEIQVGRLICVVQVIDEDADYHKLVVAYQAWVVGGEMHGADDLKHVRAVPLDELRGQELHPVTRRVIDAV